ncbi:MAG: hypothetical protein SNJ77_06230 [Cytophagales bacterium]
MAKRNLFARETEVLEYNTKISKDNTIDLETLRSEYSKLVYHYEELLDQSRLITKVSDKLQNKLNNLNESLNLKNIELQETIDELTKARIGRQAATISFVILIVLFVLEELMMGPMIDQMTNNNLWYSAGAKFILALLLKPLESAIESFLLNQVKKAKKREKEKLEQEQNDAMAK